MATYGDFSSLFQLGVGIGIGISLFRAPVNLRVAALERSMSREMSALKDIGTAFGRKKRRDVLDLYLRFGTIRTDLDRWQLPFMIAAVAGALANLGYLVVATLDKDRLVYVADRWVLLFVSIGWFLTLLAALETVAHVKLGPVRRNFLAIQVRRAPSITT